MTYEQAYDPTIRWGANLKWGRGPSQAKSFAAKGQQRSPHPVFLNFFTESRLCLKKKQQFRCEYSLRSKYTFSEALDQSSIPESFSFCWNSFCARDYFKHSEAKWRMLPSSRQSVLRGSRDSPCTEPTVYKSLTVILVSGRAFFCQSPVASTWP